MNFREIALKLFDRHGTLPSELFAQTPHELAAAFTQAAGDGADADIVEPDAELYRINHVIRVPRGLAPAIPTWFMKEVPRWQTPIKLS